MYREALEAFSAAPGSVATVLDAKGRFVARGLVDEGPIGVRVFTLHDEQLGPSLFAARVTRAVELRRRFWPDDTNALRLVHGEGDRLPGFVCDLYDQHAVLKVDGAGAAAWAETFAESLWPALEALSVRHLVLRRGRAETKQITALRGALPEGPLTVREHAMRLGADLVNGQKTGLFLDQRSARRRVRAMAQGLRVLNLYGYTGGFSIAAGLGGASQVTTVDVAPGAVALANAGWRDNGLDPAQHEGVVDDVPRFLAARGGARWELVIADPPSFAPSEAAVESALRAYRTLHTSCISKVAPGGYYLAGSCSSHITHPMLLDTLREGAAKARRVLQVVDHWGAPEDHPHLAAFTEGAYLKNVLCRIAE